MAYITTEDEEEFEFIPIGPGAPDQVDNFAGPVHTYLPGDELDEE